ncbi:MAG: hypothetical protein LBC98_00215 [Prevotellaceae bacterium]|jgi:bifunctional DNase/RNase|nr:hypothetical protein [Prevotellaceae bacterium]
MKREELDAEIDIVKFDAGLIEGGNRNLPILVLHARDGRKRQLISSNLTLFSLGYKGLENVKILIYDIITALIPEMEARIEKIVLYHDSKRYMNRSKIYVIDSEGEEHIVDAMVDHGIAQAYRTSVPLRITEELLTLEATDTYEEVFMATFDDENALLDYARNMSAEKLQNIAIEEMEILIKVALKYEEYEIAAKFKQAIQSKGDTI